MDKKVTIDNIYYLIYKEYPMDIIVSKMNGTFYKDEYDLTINNITITQNINWHVISFIVDGETMSELYFPLMELENESFLLSYNRMKGINVS